jgi:hypothetical protein
MFRHEECKKHEEYEHIYIKNKNGGEKQDLFIGCAFPLYQTLFSEKIKEAIHKMAPSKRSSNKLLQKLKSVFQKHKKTQPIEEFYKEKVEFIINHFDPIKLFDRICINNPNIYLFDNLDRAKKIFPKTTIPKIKSDEPIILVDAFKQCAKNKSYIIFSVKIAPYILTYWSNYSTHSRHKNKNHFAKITKEIQKHICGFMLYQGKTFRQCHTGKYNSTAVIIRGKICVANNTPTWKTFRNNQKLVAHLKRLLCLSSLFIMDRSKNSSLKRLPYDCMEYIFCYLGGDANRYPKENFKLVHFFATRAKNIEENIKEFEYPTFVVGNDQIDLIDKKGCEKLFKFV